jgi:hypothetical protein
MTKHWLSVEDETPLDNARTKNLSFKLRSKHGETLYLDIHVGKVWTQELLLEERVDAEGYTLRGIPEIVQAINVLQGKAVVAQVIENAKLKKEQDEYLHTLEDAINTARSKLPCDHVQGHEKCPRCILLKALNSKNPREA